MRSASLMELDVHVAFAEDRAVLGIRGEVDNVTAARLRAVLDAVIDQGPPFVVLDLAAVSFMGAVGLGVIAGAAQRLRAASGGLVIRAPSPMVQRMLDVTGLTGLVRLEQPELARRPLAREGAAEVAIDDAGTDLALDQHGEQVTDALTTRMAIAQAQGVIMQRDGVDEHVAFTSLRRMSLLSGGTLREEADSLLALASTGRPVLASEPTPHG